LERKSLPEGVERGGPANTRRGLPAQLTRLDRIASRRLARGRARRHVRKLIDEFYPEDALEKHNAVAAKPRA